MSDVAIIGGTGNQGYGLALRWSLAGKDVCIGSRDAARAEDSARKIIATAASLGRHDIRVSGLENKGAAAGARIVVVAVPLAAQIATIKSIKDSVGEGAVLVDVTVPLATAIGGRASRLLGLPAGSAAEQLAEYAPSHAQVMSAFHFLSADLLAEVGPGGQALLDCDVVACGGDAAAQAAIRDLALLLDGVRYTHAGPLVASRLVEAAAGMLIAINIRHKARHTGMRLTGLP